MKKYRKKPVVVEAVQWDGSAFGAGPIINWILAHGGIAIYIGAGEPHPLRKSNELWGDNFDSDEAPEGALWGDPRPDAPAFLVIQTLEGPHRQDADDWTIKGVKDEFYPVKPDIFDETYDLEEDES